MWSMIDGTWEETESRKLPIKRGKAFKVVIMTTSNCFRVVIDGAWTACYDFRMGNEEVEFIQVFGDINQRDAFLAENVTENAAMWQFFHTKVDDLVLFEGWKIDNAGTMALACGLIFLLGLTFEFVKWARKVSIAAMKRRQDPAASPTPFQALFAAPHLVGTAFFILQLCIGYILMLIVMTFSVWLCLSVVVGATLGFILFGDRD